MPGRYRVERWKERYSPNPAMLRHILVTEGYEVFQWSDPPGTVYGPHKHESDQSHWVIAGTLELQIHGAGSYVLGAGDRDFLPAGTYHSATVVGEEPVLYLVGEKR